MIHRIEMPLLFSSGQHAALKAVQEGLIENDCLLSWMTSAQSPPLSEWATFTPCFPKERFHSEYCGEDTRLPAACDVLGDVGSQRSECAMGIRVLGSGLVTRVG